MWITTSFFPDIPVVFLIELIGLVDSRMEMELNAGDCWARAVKQSRKV